MGAGLNCLFCFYCLKIFTSTTLVLCAYVWHIAITVDKITHYISLFATDDDCISEMSNDVSCFCLMM